MPPITTDTPSGTITPDTTKDTGAGHEPTDDPNSDMTLFPEAVAHLLTAKRRRTTVTSKSFAVIEREVHKP